VLVVLGVLAGIALPRFLDMSDQAFARGIASNLNSWADNRFVSDMSRARGNLEALSGGGLSGVN